MEESKLTNLILINKVQNFTTKKYLVNPPLKFLFFILCKLKLSCVNKELIYIIYVKPIFICPKHINKRGLTLVPL